jgi:S-formylglutathione hydrolase FrmB
VRRPLALVVLVAAFAYGPGSHDWPYWERGLHDSLPLLLKALE